MTTFWVLFKQKCFCGRFPALLFVHGESLYVSMQACINCVFYRTYRASNFIQPTDCWLKLDWFKKWHKLVCVGVLHRKKGIEDLWLSWFYSSMLLRCWIINTSLHSYSLMEYSSLQYNLIYFTAYEHVRNVFYFILWLKQCWLLKLRLLWSLC